MASTGLARVYELVQAVRESHPTMAYLLDDDEIGPLLLKLADGQFTEAVFATKLYKTNWWRKTAESRRKWGALDALDPAEAQARRSQAATQIENIQRTLGVEFTNEQWRALPRKPGGGTYKNVQEALAELSLRNGWNTDQLTDYIVSKAHFYDEGGSGAGRGGIGATMREIRAVGQQYMLPPDDFHNFKHAKRVLMGEATVETIAADFAAAARTRYGDNETMLGIIDRGGTPADYFDPIRQGIAQEMEVDASAIDLISDSRWTGVVNHADPNNGTIRPMTQTEAIKHARKDDAWQYTQGATQMGAEMGNNLLKTFGARR